ncbi:hypothetical protein [Methanosarcina mazei]|uniref:Uncharacterized protein n=1 Tax=Methanosarcina mazei TaxID=2209 RepID=A0A4P8RAD7_METMZ|nr:hypothetical protein [Methanosarcina mazei]QCR17014.1 hypothetical protein DKM28_14255 [Methanosarcina mazei]
MAKLTHLLLLLALIVWLAGSGCVGNSESDMDDERINPDAGAENGISDYSEIELTQAEIQEIDNDMIELQQLLENASIEDEIVLEEPPGVKQKSRNS